MNRNHAFLVHRIQDRLLASQVNRIRAFFGSPEPDLARGISGEPESFILSLPEPDLARGSSGEPELFMFGSPEPDLALGIFDEPVL